MKKDNQRAREAQGKRGRRAAEMDTEVAAEHMETSRTRARRPAGARSPEEEVVLTDAQEQELAACATRLADLGRRSTAQAFDYGEELSRVQAILPPKRFGAWLDANSGITTKSAKYYTRVYKELSSYRDRLEKAALAPTAMFALLGANEQAVETVIAAVESGERLTVEQIKEMTGSGQKADKSVIDPLNTPGKAGSLKIAEQRMRTNLALFHELLAGVLEHVETAVETFASGKRVTKSELAIAIELDCRHAHDLLELTLAPVLTEHSDPRADWRMSQLDPASPWGRLQHALVYLGMQDRWEKGAAFKPWITDEVYPLLKFAVRGEPLPSPGVDMAHAEDAETESTDAELSEAVPMVRQGAAEAETNVIPMTRKKKAVAEPEPELA